MSKRVRRGGGPKAKRQKTGNEPAIDYVSDDDSVPVVTQEDEEFVSSNMGFASFLTNVNTDLLQSVTKRTKKQAVPDYDKGDAVPDYEQKVRKASDWQQRQSAQKLPTKDADGNVKSGSGPVSLTRLVKEKEERLEQQAESGERLEALKEKLSKKKQQQQEQVQEELKRKKLVGDAPVVFRQEDFEWTAGKLPKFMAKARKWKTEADLMLYVQKQKEHIASLAFSVVEDPQTNYKRLHDIQVICEHVPKYEDPEGSAAEVKEARSRFQRYQQVHEQVRQLAALSLFAVFKDILPGYRVRADTSDLQDDSVKLKKEVLALRQYEHSMLAAYQRFLQHLERCMRGKRKREKPTPMFMVAVRCLTGMLTAKPEFNFRDKLLQLIVPLMGSSHEEMSRTCCTAISTLFQTDSLSEASLVAVRLMAAFVKRASYNVRPEVLMTLLDLRITEDIVSRLDKSGPASGRDMTNKQRKKMTKQQRRAEKELREVQQEMAEAAAEEDKVVRGRNQTDIIRAIFTVYFRILKKVLSSPLLPAVLAGLARFGHLINVDYQVDMLAALKEVMRRPESSACVILQCAVTAFENVKLHGNVVDVDLKEFYECVYVNLLRVPMEPEAGSLLLQTIRLMVSENRTVSAERAAAFCKRLATIALYLPSNLVLGILVALQRLMTFHPHVRQLLEVSEDRVSDAFLQYLDSPDNCNAIASTLWELTALEQHFHPTVGERSALAMAGEATRLQPAELLQQFDVSGGGFNPPIDRPMPHPLQKQVRKQPGRSFFLPQEQVVATPFFDEMQEAAEELCEGLEEEAGFEDWYDRGREFAEEMERMELEGKLTRIEQTLAAFAKTSKGGRAKKSPGKQKNAGKKQSPGQQRGKQRRRSTVSE